MWCLKKLKSQKKNGPAQIRHTFGQSIGRRGRTVQTEREGGLSLPQRNELAGGGPSSVPVG